MHVDLDHLTLIGILGALFLGVALSSAQLRRLPISSAAVYLAVGVLAGPSCLGWLRLDVSEGAVWLERTTECALMVSLFVGGLKLRQPLWSSAWTAVMRLAFPLLLGTIAVVALLAHFALGMTPAQALLTAAVLSPTDPVLASAVSVNDATDRDRVRYGLSGEAGLNDGLAFPFVLLALGLQREQGSIGTHVVDLVRAFLWSVPAGLAIGFVLGLAVGRLAVWLRSHHRDTHAPSDFLALALIALSYFLAQGASALGFLATFAAGVGLRRAELEVVRESPHPDERQSGREPHGLLNHPPAEDLVQARVSNEAIAEPAVAAGVLVAETISFGDTAERLLEVALVILVGVAIVPYWDLRGIALAAVAFFVVRPLLAQLTLLGTTTSTTQRWLLGWFGVRGIGNLYYMSYALDHGVKGGAGGELVRLTITIVAASIVLHGITAQPLLSYYERLRRRRAERRSAPVAHGLPRRR
jgi:NhaP-type Na+/H+ or K+/H+ antiporter